MMTVGGRGGVSRHGGEKDTFDRVVEQISLESGFERGRRITVEESLRQTVPKMGQRKRTIFHQMFLCLHEW